jgi:hypothetical protein
MLGFLGTEGRPPRRSVHYITRCVTPALSLRIAGTYIWSREQLAAPPPESGLI